MKSLADGIFLDRPNRFIAHVDVNGTVETVHVKNTGRCRELLLPGAAVRLEVSNNPKRKTKYDLVAVHKQELGWVNMDSQAPNKVVGEWLSKLNTRVLGKVPVLAVSTETVFKIAFGIMVIVLSVALLVGAT